MLENRLKGYDDTSPLDDLNVKPVKAIKGKKRGINKKLKREPETEDGEDVKIVESKMEMIKKVHQDRIRKKRAANKPDAPKPAGMNKTSKTKGTDLHPTVARRVKKLRKQGKIKGNPNPSREVRNKDGLEESVFSKEISKIVEHLKKPSIKNKFNPQTKDVEAAKQLTEAVETAVAQLNSVNENSINICDADNKGWIVNWDKVKGKHSDGYPKYEYKKLVFTTAKALLEFLKKELSKK